VIAMLIARFLRDDVSNVSMARSRSASFRVGFQSSSACEDYAFQAEVPDLQ
jgi:hypothetical protein